MTNLEQIDNAITSHEHWKIKLQSAVDYGRSELEYNTIKTDNHCEFGQWLYSSISKDLKKTEMYDRIIKLHADFHKEAAQILFLAINGKKQEAKKLLGLGSNYTVISSRLVTALSDWKKSIK